MNTVTTSRHVTIIAALLLLAFCLRAYQLRESLWLDELHTSWCVSGSWTDVAPRAKIGNQSPLFFYLPWLSVRLFGETEIALRFPSLIAGLLLVASVYGVVAYGTRDATSAALSGFLAAIDPNLVFYSQEARPYAAVQLVAVLHVVALWKSLETSLARWRAAYVASGVVLFYLHYTAALLLTADVAIFCILSVWRRRHQHASRYSVWRWLCDVGCMMVCGVFAEGHLRQIFLRRRNWAEIVEPDSFIGIFQLMPLDRYALLPIVGVVIAAFVGGVLKKTWSRIVVKGRGVLTIAVWYFFPVGLAWMLTATNVARVFSLRYLNVVAAAPMIFAGLCLAALPSRKGRTITALMIGGICLWLTGYAEQLRTDGRLLAERNENWRDAVRTINQSETDRDAPILLFPNLIEDREIALQQNAALREYGLFPLRGMYRIKRREAALFPFPAAANELQFTEDLRRQILEHHGAWLLVRCSPELAASIEQAVAIQWGGNTKMLRRDSQTSYGNLTLVRLRVEP